MSSRAPVLALALALAAACGKEHAILSLDAAVSAVEPACGDTARATPVAIRGVLPVKVTASLSGSGSTVDATYRAWLGDRPLDDVAWIDAGMLAATVPSGLPPGDYALTLETPFGRRVAREGAFHVQVGTCAPAGAALTSAVEVRPNTVTVGQQVTVVATVTNGGLSTALQVRGAITAPAAVQLRDASTGPVDVPPGATVTFQWTYAAAATTSAAGVTFEVAAEGRDAAGAPVVAPAARSNVLLVNSAATLSASAAAPAIVTVGQTFTFSLAVTNAGAAGALVTPEVRIAPSGVVSVEQPPAARTIAGHTQQQVAFPLRADAVGDVTLTGLVTGTDVNSGAALDVAPTAPVVVHVEASVGGSVSGLTGSGLVIALGNQRLPIAASGPFTFPTPLPAGSAYQVTVATQPSGPTQVCSVANGSGTIAAGDRANVTGVAITCVTQVTVGGSVTGLTGTGLVLGLGTQQLPIGASGPFTFPTPLAAGTSYTVRVVTPPTGQVCSVSNGTGTTSTTNVTNVAVSCVTPTFTVGGTVSGLAGAGLQLRLGAQVLSIGANGGFTFAALPLGTSYDVVVATQPAGPTQQCSVANGAGTLAADVTNVAVTCVTLSFAIRGDVTGATSSLTLSLSSSAGAQTLSPAGDGPFAFSAIPSGSTYAVSVSSRPTGETCSVSPNGSGTIGGADVTGVAVTCAPATVTLDVGISAIGNGSATGTVTCDGTSCVGVQQTYPIDGSVTLVATPDGTFTFRGWTGPCQGITTATCTFTIVASSTVTAIFGP